MQKSEVEAPIVAQTSGVEFRGEVFFDPELLLLEGRYSDELSAHRARRRWSSVFSTSFLLESKHDYELSVKESSEDEGFALRCEFLSACGRYAFWRITHGQAPEAQHLLETAHVPCSDSRLRAIAFAADLRPSKKNGAGKGVDDVLPFHRWIEWDSIFGWFMQRRADVRRFCRQTFQ